MFENLQAYYDYLENDNSLSLDFNVTKSLILLRDKTVEQELKTICSYEIFFSDFTIFNGELESKISLASGESYPNLGLFKDDLKYILSRAETVRNPKYSAKYNHLLWESKQKHNKYAKKAIDSYYSFLKNVIIPPDNLSNFNFGTFFKNLFILSQKINYKKEEAIQLIVSLLGTKKINDYHEYFIMKFIAEEGKKIDPKNLQFFFNYSNKVIDENHYPGFEVEFLQLLIILCQKLKHSPKSYHNKLAEFHIAQSRKHEDSFVVHDYYLKALAEYQKAGNKKEIEKVTILVEKAKKNLNLKLIKYEHTDERIQKYWDMIIKMTDELTEKYTAEEIYSYIITSNHIFPQSKVLNENVDSVLLDIVTIINFDINKNVSQKQTGIINPYSIHIQNFSINHLWMIFSKGIKTGKVSFASLIEFFKNHSWYGQNFTYTNADGEVDGFNWLELLSPSLLSFFTQIEIGIKLNTYDNQGYILAIDSLVLKFEGLLREFSRSIGAQTIEIREDGTEERISFEKLLENEKLQKIVPKDDIALLKFIFLSEGLNLRNNIAHCFYRTKNYSPSIMLLLISALLKLGNYEKRPLE